MHSSQGGWDIAPYEGPGWGTPEGGGRAREPAPSRNPRNRKEPRRERNQPEECKEEKVATGNDGGGEEWRMN
eukprot:1571344-Karenia_brevis.AAC.1